MKKLLLIASLLIGTAVAHALPFETTTDPLTFPIQWYFLKCNGRYLYALGDELAVGTSASSSDDAYLWCFVTTSQGKTVIYNKDLKKFLNDGWYFSTSRYLSTIDFVDYRSGNSFYICFMDGNTKYYLDADEEGVSYSTSPYSGFTAVNALYEGLIEPSGTLVFPDPTVYDDHCTIEFNYHPGEGDSGCELRLYINGTWVGMPYTIQRTNEVQTVEATAKVTFVNPRIIPVEVTKTFEIPALDDNPPGPVVDLNTAMNIDGGNIKFVTEGTYPWVVVEDGGRAYGMSSNQGKSNSTSTVTATVNLDKTSMLSFEFKAWGEGINTAWDKCAFVLDGEEKFAYGARQNDWETYAIDLPAGTHTLTWSYSKDSDTNPTGDYFAVDNVKIVSIDESFTEPTLTPYDVYTPNNVQTDPKEDYYKLFDKNKSTKWCVDNSTGSWETIWVDFKSSLPFRPTSYTMTTGNDTQSWYGRNPKKWKIYAKANENDSWTTIVNVTNGENEGLGTANTTDCSFDINGANTKYQYFRFEVSEVCGRGGWQNNHYVFQLAELALKGYASTVVAGDVNGDGFVSSVDVTALYNWLLNGDDSTIVNGDQDGDGVITSVDITIIYNILLGN